MSLPPPSPLASGDPSPPASDICVLFSSIDAAHAADFARQACEARLVACVNALPGAQSTYWWEGRVCQESEVLLWMEAPAADATLRIAALAALHPYDTPKIVALSVHDAHDAYRAWCLQETRPVAGARG